MNLELLLYCVCVVIPFILDVRFVDVPAGGVTVQTFFFLPQSGGCSEGLDAFNVQRKQNVLTFSPP